MPPPQVNGLGGRIAFVVASMLLGGLVTYAVAMTETTQQIARIRTNVGILQEQVRSLQEHVYLKESATEVHRSMSAVLQVHDERLKQLEALHRRVARTEDGIRPTFVTQGDP